jgi:hypothetical protein
MSQSAPDEQSPARDEEGSGSFVIKRESSTMLPPEGAEGDTAAVTSQEEPQALADEELEVVGPAPAAKVSVPPPVPAEIIRKSLMPHAPANSQAEAAIQSALQPLYEGARPSERAELRIDDLSFQLDNPYARSSLVPPTKKPFPVGKALLGGLAVIGVTVGAYAGAMQAAMHRPPAPIVVVQKAEPAPVATVAAPVKAAPVVAVAAPTPTPAVVVPVTSAPAATAVPAAAAPAVAPAPSASAPAAAPVVAPRAPVAVAAVAPKVVATPSAADKPAVHETVRAAPAAAAPAAEAKVEAKAEPKPETSVAAAEKPAAPASEPATKEAAKAEAPAAEPAAAPAAAAPAEDALPETLSREQVAASFEKVREQLSACAEGGHGVATANVTISGAGRVTYAMIEGSFAGTPQGSCMAREVRKASFPHFSDPNLKVSYPFSL